MVVTASQHVESVPAAGVEGGSKRLSGWQLMEVWDRLCNMLRALGVSVEDVSNKAHSRPSCAFLLYPRKSNPTSVRLHHMQSMHEMNECM